jgi:hypothetical protein
VLKPRKLVREKKRDKNFANRDKSEMRDHFEMKA